MITALIVVFIVGYAAITFEHGIGINKAATALVTGVLCWTVYILSSQNTHLVVEQLTEHLGELSGILFSLSIMAKTLNLNQHNHNIAVFYFE